MLHIMGRDRSFAKKFKIVKMAPAPRKFQDKRACKEMQNDCERDDELLVLKIYIWSFSLLLSCSR